MISTASDVVARREEAERGRQFVSIVIAKHYAAGEGLDAYCAAFEARSGKQHLPIAKAAVTAMDTSSALHSLAPLSAAFIAATDRESILSQLPGAIRVPPGVQARVQIFSLTARVVTEGGVKTFGRLAYEAPAESPTKVVAQIAISAELAKSLDVVAQESLRASLVSALAPAIDAYLVEQFTAGTAIPATSADAATVGELLAALSGGHPVKPIVIGSYPILAQLAPALADLRALGVGIVPSAAAGDSLIAVDASGLLLVDGGAELAIARHATVLLDDGEEPTSTAAEVSLFQNNLIALRAERIVQVHYRPDAVAYAEIA